MDRPLTAAGYFRQSKQKDDDLSPAVQRRAFQQYAELRSLDLQYVEGDIDYSWFRLPYWKRPGLVSILSLVEQGLIDRLLIYRISRLSRRQREFLEIYDVLEEHGVGLVSITENFDTGSIYGRLMMRLLANFAQLHSEELSETISDVQREQAERGIVPGGLPPYGVLRHNNEWSRDPETFPVLEQMFKWAAEGHPLREI